MNLGMSESYGWSEKKEPRGQKAACGFFLRIGASGLTYDG